MSVHLLVELEDLPNWRVNGIYAALLLIPGAKMACTLETIGRETLDQFLRVPEPEPVPKRKRRKASAA